MLDQEALEIAYGRLSAESVEWQRSFNAKLQRVQNEFRIKGMGTSSALIEAVADICAQEVETRANRVCEVLRGLLQGAKGPPSDEDVKKLYSDFDRLYITYCYSEPQRRFDEACRGIGIAQSATDSTSFENRAIAARLKSSQKSKSLFVRYGRPLRTKNRHNLWLLVVNRKIKTSIPLTGVVCGPSFWAAAAPAELRWASREFFNSRTTSC
jgi:hypothetical protein